MIDENVMDALTFFMRLGRWPRTEGVMNWWSTEKPCQRASNSEIRRWFAKGSILINGERAKTDDEIIDIRSLVIHPKSKKGRITIF